MCANLGAPQAAKEALGLISRAVAVRVGYRMIDPLGQIARMQLIPMRGFVGINRAAMATRSLIVGTRPFGLEHERERPAVALAHDDDDAALAGLIRQGDGRRGSLCNWRADVTAKIGAVDFDFARDALRRCLRRDGFADFVRQDESRLVLAIQVAAELQARYGPSRR